MRRLVVIGLITLMVVTPPPAAGQDEDGESGQTVDPIQCNFCYAPAEELLGRDIPGRRPGGDSVPVSGVVGPSAGEVGVAGEGPALARPSHGEVVELICPVVPLPVVGHNPRSFGITGWESWLWDAADPRPVSATGSIRGYSVSCAVTPVSWTVDTGDVHAAEFGHRRVHHSDVAGWEGEGTPVRHMWERKGTFTVSVVVTWDRVSSVGADRVVRSASVAYPVKEVRSGMTTPDS